MTSSAMQIKNLTTQIQTLTNELNASIQGKVATLTSQIDELTALSDTSKQQINTLKKKSKYIFQHTGECEGIFNTPGNIQPISYGAGAGNDIGFGLYIPFKCRIHRMVLQSVFGPNEVANPEVQISI